MKYIDLETYPRRSHYEFFKRLAYPYVGMTANMDVTDLIAKAKAMGKSTFLACLYVGIQAANRVPELRQRIVGDKIVEFDFCNAAHTVALADETFGNCLTDGQLSFEDFLEDAKARQEETKHHHGFVGTQEDETPLLFFSCVPWVAFTQVIQPAPIPADCNPRIVYGKFIKEGDRILMPVGIQANHALVDGRHIGKFYQAFEEISREVCSTESLQP